MTKNTLKKSIPRPVVMIVLDGWGISQPYAGNAISLANKPVFDELVKKYPAMTLRASGEAVGLPWGEAGNSEVGHLNLGLGRVIYQELPKINKQISDNSFFANTVLKKAFEHVKKNNSQMHFVGLVSDGSVHSSLDHLYALMEMAEQSGHKKVFIHAILDGRDTSLDSGAGFITAIEQNINKHGLGKIATVSGRYYAMDRNNNWDRIAKAYLAMTEGRGNKAKNAKKAVLASYKKKVYDEEFLPTVICDDNGPVALIEDNDAFIFFNFRPDRARQLTKAFVVNDLGKFSNQKKFTNLYFSSFTEYEKGLPVQIVFPPVKHRNSLGRVLSKNGLKQLRIAETEKYAHVTYFFNGGQETKDRGEEHILIPSKPVSSYDLAPGMSASEISAKVVEVVADDIYDFILINYANADMVGHTGNIKAAIKAVEVLDTCLGKVVDAVLAKNGVLMISADHGNAEVMYNMQTGQIDKEHTNNPVPFLLIGNDYAGRSIGWLDTPEGDLSTTQTQGILSDLAPTVLEILNIPKPDEMTGISLLSSE